jgi:hypothetical protein
VKQSWFNAADCRILGDTNGLIGLYDVAVLDDREQYRSSLSQSGDAEVSSFSRDVLAASGHL